MTCSSVIDQARWRTPSTGRACTLLPPGARRCSKGFEPIRESWMRRVILFTSNRSGVTSPPTTASPSP